jgi:hypothetical protein
MSDFILAMVSIVYVLVCLTNEDDQEKCSTSFSAKNNMKMKAKGRLLQEEGERARRCEGEKEIRNPKLNNPELRTFKPLNLRILNPQQGGEI